MTGQLVPFPSPAPKLPTPRIVRHGHRIYLSCHRGHYITTIDARDWAGSAVESMAGQPERCPDCADRPAPELPAPVTDRNEAIAAIRAALRRRTGRAWSVTGGRGTVWGWITVDAPPSRATWGYRLRAGAVTDRPEDYEPFDTGEPGRLMSPEDRAELARLLGLESVPVQGVSIPAGHDYRTEYVDRAEGRVPRTTGTPYWD